MACKLPKEEPSLISRKLNPPFESRRVRIQPCTRTSRPTWAADRASLTRTVSIASILRALASMLVAQPTLRVKGCHAAAAGGRYGLAIIVVGHVSRGKNAFDACVRAEGDRPADVLLVRKLELALDEVRVGRMSNRQKHPRRFQV